MCLVSFCTRQSVKGDLRSSEFKNVLEQDPLGGKHGTGGNDDIWGEWLAPPQANAAALH